MSHLPKWKAIHGRVPPPLALRSAGRRPGPGPPLGGVGRLLGATRMAADMGLDVDAAVAGPVSAKRTRTCQDPAAGSAARLQRWQGHRPRPQASGGHGGRDRAPGRRDSTARREPARCANARTPLPSAPRTWPRRPCGRADPGPPSGHRRSGPSLRKRGGTASAFSTPTATAGASPTGSALGDVADLGSFAQVAHRSLGYEGGRGGGSAGRSLSPQMPTAGHSARALRAQVEL